MNSFDDPEDSRPKRGKSPAESALARELLRQRRTLAAERLAALFSLGATPSSPLRAPKSIVDDRADPFTGAPFGRGSETLRTPKPAVGDWNRTPSRPPTVRHPPKRHPHPASGPPGQPSFWRDLTSPRPAALSFDAWVRSAEWRVAAEAKHAARAVEPAEDRTGAERRRVLERFLDILPGAITWTFLLATVVGAVWVPIVPIALTIALQLYWGLRGLGIAIFGFVGVHRIVADRKVDWRARYAREALCREDALEWGEIRHIVLVPNYKEPIHVLRNTLEALAAQQDVNRNIFVVLAMEAQEEGAGEKAQLLEREFAPRLGGVFHTLHPSDLPGEVTGKSANEAWAGRWAYEHFVLRLGYAITRLTITSCDADSVFHPSYFSCLSYHFAINPNRHLRVWQAPLFFHNNAWDIPAYIRLVSLFMSVNQLAQLAGRGRQTFPISTYSASFALVHGVGGWDPDIIPEDWHMFLKCFFARQGRVRVEPIFLPVSADAPQAETTMRTVKSRYAQALRHAWGITDFRYAVSQSLRHREIPFLRKLPKVAAVLREHLLLSVSWIVLVIGFALPHLTNPGFFASDVGAFCLKLYGDLIIGATLVSPIFPIMDYILSGPPKNRARWLQIPQAVIEWNLMPLLTILFVSVPSVHAQSMLMFGKQLVYQVTEKVAPQPAVASPRKRPARRQH